MTEGDEGLRKMDDSLATGQGHVEHQCKDRGTAISIWPPSGDCRSRSAEEINVPILYLLKLSKCLRILPCPHCLFGTVTF